MIRPCKRIAAAGAFALVFGLGCDRAQAVPLTADFEVTAEDTGGLALDAAFSVSPSDRFTLKAGVGHSRGSSESGDLRGTLINAGASLHGDRAGVSLGYDLFDDSSNYRARTLGARAWVSAGDFEFALLGRQRDLDVELTLELPLRTVRREVGFSAMGGGLQVTFSHGSFNAYAMALQYDFDEEFDDFLGLVDSPQLESRPRIEALVGSFLTQAQGAIDRQSGAGIERSFGRNSVALDLSQVHDAVRDASSVSVALTWRRAQSAHMDWMVSAGMIDSDTYGGIAFLGVGVGLAN
jgi:hypothetical protein